MTHYFEKVKAVTLPIEDPGADSTLEQYRIVVFDTGLVDEPAAVGDDDIAGVTMDRVTKAEYDDGRQEVSVAPMTPGYIIPVQAGEAITVGALIGITATTGLARIADTSGDTIVGIAMTAAGAANDLFSMFVIHQRVF